MASDLDRLIIDLQARLGEAETLIKNLTGTVSNLNRFSGNVVGAGATGKVAVWKNSGEVSSSAYLSETPTNLVIGGGNFVPAVDGAATTGGVILGQGGTTPLRFKEIWTLDLQTNSLTDAGAGFIELGDTASLVPKTDNTITLGATVIPGTSTPSLKSFKNIVSKEYSYDATHLITWGTGEPGPTGANIVADVGSEYFQLDGTPGGVQWVKESGNGTSNGWQKALLDGANRFLSNLALTDPANPHTSQVQINADLLPGAGKLVDIGSKDEAFESLFTTNAYPANLGSFGTAAGTPTPLVLKDSIKPLGGLTLGLLTDPFLSVYSTKYLFENSTGIFHGATDPAALTMTGYGPGWIYIKDAGGPAATLWIKETAATSAVWTAVGGVGAGGSGTVGPGSVPHLARFTATTVVGDSGITDDGSVIRVLRDNTELHQSTLNLYDLTFVGADSSIGVWRYEHRPNSAGGVLDPINNTLGEFQVVLGSTPAIGIGQTATTINKGTLAIWRSNLYAGPVFSIWDETATNQQFTINQVGDLRVIKQVNYRWPSSAPNLGTGGSPKVLAYTASPSTSIPAGIAELDWIDLATGGVAGNGHVGKHAYWTGTTLGAASSTIGDSNITHNVESLGGDGTTQILCRVGLFERTPGSPVTDLEDVAWRIGSDTALSGGQTTGVLRYERRSSGGTEDSLNQPDGEFQFFLNGSLKAAWVGNHSVGSKSSFYVAPPSGYTGPVLVTRDPTTSADNFKVNYDGDLMVVRGLAYHWPTSTPTGTRVLGYTFSSGTPQLNWVSTVVGSGTATHIPKFIDATTLGDSNIIDDGSVISLTATDHYLIQANPATDYTDLFFRTGTGVQALWRYRHTAMDDSANTTGEMACFLPSAGTLSAFEIGAVHTYANSGLRVHVPAGYTGGDPFAVLDPATTSSVFSVAVDGNLSIVRGLAYNWPTTTPTGTKVLGYTFSSGTPQLNWVNVATGNIGGSGTTNHVAKFTGASVVGDSNIFDDGSGITLTANEHYIIQLNPSTDYADLFWRTGTGVQALWRYRHASMDDPLNTSGEMACFLPGSGTLASFEVGAIHTYANSGLRVHVPVGFTGGDSFAVLDPSTTSAVFSVAGDGDLTVIRGISYNWPTSAPIGTRVLGYTLAAGVPQLNWVTAATGNITGSGTTNHAAKFTGANSIGDSNIIDDGSGITLTANEHYIIQLTPSTDYADLFWRTGTGAQALWRYRHASMDDSANTAGEMACFLPGSAGLAAFEVGNIHTYANSGLRVHVPAGYSGGAPFAVLDPTTTSVVFSVDVDGNPGVIRGATYSWPTTHGAGVLSSDASGNLTWSTSAGAVTSVFGRTGVVVATAPDYAAFYLALTGGTLTGPLILSADPTTGLGAATKNYVDTLVNTNVNGTVNWLSKFTSAHSIGNSGISDDGSVVTAHGVQFRVTNSTYDLSDLVFETNAGNFAIWRYEHRAGGMWDPTENTAGEMQIFFNSTSPSISFGPVRTGFPMDLSIKGINYVWPTSNTAGALQNDGAGHLVWSPTTSAVTSVFGRVGVITADPADYAAYYLKLSGGIMTGSLQLASDPTTNLQAATKQYVDTKTTFTGTAYALPKYNVGGLGFVDSHVIDDGSTITFTANQHYITRLDSSDFVDLFWKTGTGAQAQWRYRHTAMDDSANTAGEMACFLPGSGGLAAFEVGNIHTYANSGLRVHLPTGYTGGVPFAVLDPTTTSAVFSIGGDGNLGVIRGTTYVWPAAHAAGVLSSDASGNLSWSSAAGAVSSVFGRVGTVVADPADYAAYYLKLVGGTLTGPLVLAADPTSNLQAATKQYVDSVALTAGAVSSVFGRAGAVVANSGDYAAYYLALGGGTLSGALTLAADPTSNLQAATKQYVDSHTSFTGTAYALSKYNGSGVGFTSSNVTDDGTTISLTANQHLIIRQDTSDFVGLFWRTGAGNQIEWRYRHTGMDDAANTAGEMALFLPGMGTTPAFEVGNIHTWVQNGLRIRATAGYTGGAPFELWQSGTTSAKFRVDDSGNLSLIKAVSYIWPGANASGVLTNDGSGNLVWTPPAAISVTSVFGRTGAVTAVGADYSSFYLGLGGGTLTGPLVLAADPTTSLQAATKQYVDSHTGFTGTAYALSKYNAAGVGFASSNVTDDGSTISLTANQHLIIRQDTSDFIGLFFKTGAGNQAEWRYRHAFLDDSANATSGEMALFMPGSGGLAVFEVGAVHTYVQSGLRVRPPSGYTGGASFEVQQVGTGTPVFRVDNNGNLSLIKGNSYVWPDDSITPGVLTNDATGTLRWLPSPSAPVTSVFGRTGVISALSGDYAAFYLGLGGGTLTGPLTLAADPTANLQAATKQYVDTKSTFNGTANTVAKYNASGVGFANSRITDDGTNTQVLASTIILKQAAANDWADIYWRTNSNNDCLVRWQHAPGAVTASANSSYGEMQFFLGADVSLQIPSLAIGRVETWVQTAFRVRQRSGLTSGNPLEVWSTGASVSAFAIADNGDIVKIKGQSYTWPSSSTTTAGYVLTNNGSGGLTWAAGATGGGVTGSGSVNYIARWTGTNSIGGGSSGLYDDGTYITAIGRAALLTNAGNSCNIGSSSTPFAAGWINSISLGPGSVGAPSLDFRNASNVDQNAGLYFDGNFVCMAQGSRKIAAWTSDATDACMIWVNGALRKITTNPSGATPLYVV